MVTPNINDYLRTVGVPLLSAVVGGWAGASFALRVSRAQRSLDRKLVWAESLLDYLGAEWAAYIGYWAAKDRDLTAIEERIRITSTELRDRRLTSGYALSSPAIQRASWESSHALFRASSSLRTALGAEELESPQAVLWVLSKRLEKQRVRLAEAIRTDLGEQYYMSVDLVNLHGRSPVLSALTKGVTKVIEGISNWWYNRQLARAVRHIRAGLPYTAPKRWEVGGGE